MKIDEHELMEELRGFPKLQIPADSSERFYTAIRQCTLDEKKRRLRKISIGALSGLAAVLAVTIGIYKFDPLSTIEDGSAANPVKHAEKEKSKTEVPKQIELYGRTIEMDKVVAELGDRREPFGLMLANWRDTIDKGGDLTSAFSAKYSDYAMLFPEMDYYKGFGRELSNIETDGILYEKNKELNPNTIPPIGWNAEKQAKYEELRKSHLRPFLSNLWGMSGNAGMYSSGDQRDDPKYQQRIKEIRDTFDMYSNYFLGK